MRKFTVWLTCLFMFISISLAYSQTKTITGTVKSTDGLPLPGVTVLVPGTTIGTTTDIEGKYSITIQANHASLRFQYVGMISQDIIIGTNTVINVVLEEDTFQLGEVIVVAYGTSTKEAFTGSAAVVDEKKIASRAITSPIAAIEGSTTGVRFISPSGQPGSNPQMIIRGVGTLNGITDPLYVVDGVPYGGSLSDINPEDIKSMTVLKDASSTALYGSRGANGVVLITTKSGSKQEGLKVSATISKGFLSPGMPFYERVGAKDYYELMWQAYKNSLIRVEGLSESEAATRASDGIADRLSYNPFNVARDQIVGTNGKINPSAQVILPNLDWYDELQQVGRRDNISVNVSTGNEKFDLYFSTSYLEEEGYIIETAFNRLSSRFNTNFRPNDKLAMSAGLNIALSKQEGPFSRGTNYANPFFFAGEMGPIYPVYLAAPTTGEYILNAAGEKQFDLGGGYNEYGIPGRPINIDRHAVAEVQYNNDKRKTNAIGARYNVNYQIIDGLKLQANLGMDIQDYMKKEYENHIVGDGAPNGRYNETRFRRKTVNFNQLLTYIKRFNNGHNVDVTLGHETYDYEFSTMSGMKNTQTAVGISEFDNFSQTSDLSGHTNEAATEGYFARINYNYKDKYYLSASARRDGSSRIAPNVRWGNFYSVGGSWRMDQEDFIKNIKFIDALKLRASWGQVGQDNLGDPYLWQARYSILPNAGSPGIFWSDLGNDALTWETTESFDIALEFAVLSRRLEGSIEFYKQTHSDLLYNVPIPLSNGLNAGPANAATLYNQGIEICLTGRIINKKDLKWDMTLQASSNKNKITQLPDPFVDGSKRWEEGRSRYDFFIYHYASVDPDNGDALYYMWDEVEEGVFEKVLNEDGSWATTNDWDEAGKGYADASPIPDVYGSIRNELTYKNWELSILFTYGIGGDILDYGYANMMHEGDYGSSLHPDQLGGWRKPGDITDIPRMENGNLNLHQTMSTRFLTDGSYLALRSLNLAYTFKNKVVKDLGFSSVRVFFAGENLFLISARKGLDPQFNLAGTPDARDYNPSKVVSFGLNINL